MAASRMTGADYAKRIAAYVARNFADRGITVYREVPLGKTVIGKNRRLDLLLVQAHSDRAFAVECKYQDQQGTVDEKIPYALEDLIALRHHMPGCIAYAGEGMSQGITRMLEGSPFAAFCFPGEKLERTKQTEELDHLLAMSFGWWDLITAGATPFQQA